MSVPEGLREEGKFALAIKAEALARYTISISANEKVFLPEYQRALTDDIITQAKNAYILIREANDIQVKTQRDWRERDRVQKEAIKCLKRLLCLIDLAFKVFHLSSKRVKYWGGMVIDVRNKTAAWNRSDSSRYTFDK